MLSSLTGQNLPATRETWVQPLAWEDPPQEDIATHSSILAWRSPMDKEAWWDIVHGLTQSQHDWVTKHIDSTVLSWISMWLTFSHHSVLKSCCHYLRDVFPGRQLSHGLHPSCSPSHHSFAFALMPLTFLKVCEVFPYLPFLSFLNSCLHEGSELASSIASSPHTQNTAQRSCPLNCVLTEWTDENQGRRERMECWTQQEPHNNIWGMFLLKKKKSLYLSEFKFNWTARIYFIW